MSITAVIQKSPSRIFKNSVVINWVVSNAQDFNRYEIHIGQSGFIPDATTLRETITVIGRNKVKITGLEPRTRYEVLVRVVSNIEEFADSNRKVIYTADDWGEIIIAQDSDNYKAWPALFCKKDGTVTVAYGNSYQHLGESPEGFVELREISVLNKVSDLWESYSEPLENGRRHITNVVMDSGEYLSMGEYSGTTAYMTIFDEPYPPFPNVNLGNYTEVLLDSLPTDVYQYLITFFYPLKLSNGAILVSSFAKKLNVDAREIRNYISFDNGRNWSLHSTLTTTLTDGWNEPTFLHLSGTYPNEHLLIFLRNNTTGNHIAESFDSGKTWSTPWNINDNLPPNVDCIFRYAPMHSVYKDGKVYVSVGRRAQEPYTAHWLLVSSDFCHTWDAALKIEEVYRGYTGNQWDFISDHGYTFIHDAGEKEIWVGYYTIMGTPISKGGNTNPFIGMKKVSTETLTIKDAGTDIFGVDGAFAKTVNVINQLMPFCLNSSDELYLGIILPLYTDATLTTPDNSAGTIIKNQLNQKTKYIHNNSTKPVFTRLCAIVKTKATPNGPIVSHKFTSDGITLQPDEAQPRTVDIELTGITDTIVSVDLYPITEAVN